MVLISEVRTSGTSLRFSSPVSSPWTTLFQCDDLLGLAVGDASFNSIRSHFLTFGINWNIPYACTSPLSYSGLGIVGEYQGSTDSISFGFCKISNKNTLGIELWRNRYLFWTSAAQPDKDVRDALRRLSTEPRHNLVRAIWLVYSLVGNNSSYSTHRQATVCVGQVLHSLNHYYYHYHYYYYYYYYYYYCYCYYYYINYNSFARLFENLKLGRDICPASPSPFLALLHPMEWQRLSMNTYFSSPK